MFTGKRKGKVTGASWMEQKEEKGQSGEMTWDPAGRGKNFRFLVQNAKFLESFKEGSLQTSLTLVHVQKTEDTWGVQATEETGCGLLQWPGEQWWLSGVVTAQRAKTEPLRHTQCGAEAPFQLGV